MKAIQLHETSNGPTLQLADVAQPVPGKADVLVRVHAAGIIPTELEWQPTIQTKSGAKRSNAIPSHEFSGVIAAKGEEVTAFTVGQAVYGFNDWYADGALAELCLTQPSSIATKPSTLTDEEAASVPISALTAWQALFVHAKLQPSQRILIHGASGAVGTFAVQLARRQGAYIVATASTRNLALVEQLGANEVIDYKTTHFQDIVRDIDVVFDTVGGQTRDLSWSVLKPSGRFITIASDSETDLRLTNSFFIVEPNQQQLKEVASLLDAGELKTFVNAVVPLEDAAKAYEKAIPNARGYGKVVVKIS
ncbi:MAG TPA: NADP-dependent oxidoreductase [Edaphobacter sp.]|jgi:NADPH:quinone reductase-like Zn-dependent oxidoreductase|nr:NADP-dependent oxidoreductase [Edaphobacter sp.]